MKKICTMPFTTIRIDCGGIYTCCPDANYHRAIGHIDDENITNILDIWNSDKAYELRKNILNGDYSLCNLKTCREINLQEDDGSYSFENPALPKFVKLSYDRECNIRCITCRDSKIKNSKDQLKLYNEKIETILLPLLNSANIIELSGSGEAFYSEHSRRLIKRLTASNKSIKFVINTNGLLFNEGNIRALGLKGRILSVLVSVHSLKEDVYNKIMVGSNLKTVIKNVKYISTLYNKGEIETAHLMCVISDMNYTEIPSIIDFVKELNIYVDFSIYLPWGSSLDNNYKQLAVWKKDHKNHDHLVEILKEARMKKYDKCKFPPAFENI